MEHRFIPLIKTHYLYISDMRKVIQDVESPVPDPEQMWITSNIKATRINSVLVFYGKSAENYH